MEKYNIIWRKWHYSNKRIHTRHKISHLHTL